MRLNIVYPCISLQHWSVAKGRLRSSCRGSGLWHLLRLGHAALAGARACSALQGSALLPKRVLGPLHSPKLVVQTSPELHKNSIRVYSLKILNSNSTYTAMNAGGRCPLSENRGPKPEQ